MSVLKRQLFAICIVPAIILACSPRSSLAEDTGKPNVLLIMADDLNTALSGYGHPQCKTPNLDRLATAGTSFTRAYCQWPRCGPSRSSIMSGMYPESTGAKSNSKGLGKTAMTLPRLFKNSGYWSGRVSKLYHMNIPGDLFVGANGTDHENSWTERYNVRVMESLTPGKAEDVMLEDSTPFYPELRKKWKELPENARSFSIGHGNNQGGDFVIVETDVPDAELADGAAADKAIGLLKERANANTPFFLGVGFVRPHVPLVAPRRSFKSYDVDQMILPEVPPGDLDDIPEKAKGRTNARKFKMSIKDQKKVLRGYYASVSYMDEQVGRLLNALDALGLRKNTIVVFMSDHGYHLGEHTMWQKCSLFEECIRVPLIISTPKQKMRNSTCNAIVELIDLYPTLASLAHLKPPKTIQGRNFAHLLDNPNGDAVREDALSQVGNHFCLRTKRWAFMHYGYGWKNTAWMLYDMQKDPRQLVNLAGKPEFTEIQKQLQARLNKRVEAARKVRKSKKRTLNEGLKR